MKNSALVSHAVRALLLACGTSSLVLQAHAVETGDAAAADCPCFAHADPVDDDVLASVRGGFEFGSGLKISFTIERAVYLNGGLVSNKLVEVPDLGKLSGDQASAVQAAVAQASEPLQIGPGNLIQPGSAVSQAGTTLIQNSLDAQQIRNLTTINATANSLAMLKNINLQSVLGDALARATMPH